MEITLNWGGTLFLIKSLLRKTSRITYDVSSYLRPKFKSINVYRNIRTKAKMREDGSENKFIGLKFRYKENAVVMITSEKFVAEQLLDSSTAEAKFWWLHAKKCWQYEKRSKTLARNTGHELVSAGNREARTTISRMPQSSGNYAENITTEVLAKAKDLIRDGSICTAHLLG